jgi:hypothetical protein
MTSTALITSENFATLQDSVDVLLGDLRAHTNLPLTLSHGGVTVVNQPIYDNNPAPFDNSPGSPVGNKVGDVTLLVRVGNLIYRIPASLSPTGPAKVAVITVPLPAEAFSFSPPGTSQPSVLLSCSFNATQPTTVEWQTLIGGVWTTMLSGTYYAYGGAFGSVAAAGGHSYGGTGGDATIITATLTYSSGGGSASVTSGQMKVTSPSAGAYALTPQVATLLLPFASQNTTGKLFLGQVRLKIDNTAIGGGVIYSTAVQCTLEDQTDSWLCTLVSNVQPFTLREQAAIVRLRSWAQTNHAEIAAAYLGETGKTLASTIQQAGVSPQLVVRINSILAVPDITDQYAQYFDLVKECFQTYWPTCPDPLIRQILDQNRI